MGEKGEIVIYQTQDGITQLDVRLDGETVWITQEQMAQLFERDRTAIGRHISNFFAEGELDKIWYVQILHTPLSMVSLPPGERESNLHNPKDFCNFAA